MRGRDAAEAGVESRGSLAGVVLRVRPAPETYLAAPAVLSLLLFIGGAHYGTTQLATGRAELWVGTEWLHAVLELWGHRDVLVRLAAAMAVLGIALVLRTLDGGTPVERLGLGVVAAAGGAGTGVLVMAVGLLVLNIVLIVGAVILGLTLLFGLIASLGGD